MSGQSGTYLLADQPIDINPGRPTMDLSVTNAGDRAVQIGSHFHFFEVNRSLIFDRGVAYGMRLAIPAGTAARFEPGDTKEITLAPIGGSRTVIGCNGLVNGELDASGARIKALNRAKQRGFQDVPVHDQDEVSL